MIVALDRLRRRFSDANADNSLLDGNDPVRVNAASLIELHRTAQGLPLKVGKISHSQSVRPHGNSP